MKDQSETPSATDKHVESLEQASVDLSKPTVTTTEENTTESLAQTLDEPDQVVVANQAKATTMSPASSRLVAHQQKKLLRQTLLLLFLFVVGSIVFVVIIFPNAPRLITLLVPDSGSGQSDTIPPQPPVLYSVPVATQSAQLTLTGFAEPEAEVVFSNSGTALSPLTADAEGAFTLEIELTQGENVLTGVATDAAGNISRSSREYQVALDTQPPEIILSDELLAGLSIVGKENKQYTLEGTTEPLAKVLIADRFVFADNQGVFRFPFDLTEGENKLQITSIDKADNQTSLEIVITYRP